MLRRSQSTLKNETSSSQPSFRYKSHLDTFGSGGMEEHSSKGLSINGKPIENLIEPNWQQYAGTMNMLNIPMMPSLSKMPSFNYSSKNIFEDYQSMMKLYDSDPKLLMKMREETEHGNIDPGLLFYKGEDDGILVPKSRRLTRMNSGSSFPIVQMKDSKFALTDSCKSNLLKRNSSIQLKGEASELELKKVNSKDEKSNSSKHRIKKAHCKTALKSKKRDKVEKTKPSIEAPKLERVSSRKSEELTKPIQKSLSKAAKEADIITTAYSMIENCKLDIKPLKGKLSFEDKVYISNILNVLLPKVYINPDLPDDKYVTEINENLKDSQPEEKRNDDKMRWVFKRAIRYFLCTYTDYEPNKLHRREDNMDTLTARFFPKNKEMEKELLNSSFASKKKLTKMFELSPIFKKEFLEFTNVKLTELYKTEVIEHFEKMRTLVNEILENEPNAWKSGFLKNHHKRLYWRNEDVVKTIEQINKLVKNKNKN